MSDLTVKHGSQYSNSYQDNPFRDIDRRWDGAVSTRHEPTGLNFTLGIMMSF